MTQYLYNAYLLVRYLFFKRFIKRVDFGVPTFTEDFNNPSFIVSDNNEYNEPMVTKKENVELKDGKLLLHVKYENKEFEGWWGKKNKIWSVGWVDYTNRPIKRGVISVKCKLPIGGAENWPAIWCLRERHPQPETKVCLGVGVNRGRIVGCSNLFSAERINLNWYVWYDDKIVGFVKNYDKVKGWIEVDRDIPKLGKEYVYVSTDHITPELDVMEIIHGKIQQTIHYGYSVMEYRTTEWNQKLGKPDTDKIYTFSVEITDKGYNMYIDGCLTGVLRDKESITDAKTYLILNNAKTVGVTSGKDTVFEIHGVNFYEK